MSVTVTDEQHIPVIISNIKKRLGAQDEDAFGDGDDFDDFENMRIENPPKNVVGSPVFMWKYFNYDDMDDDDMDTEIVTVQATVY